MGIEDELLGAGALRKPDLGKGLNCDTYLGDQLGSLGRSLGGLPSLKLTASSHLKMDGWNTNFLLGRPIFRGFHC